MFIELINCWDEKVFVRTEDIRSVKLKEYRSELNITFSVSFETGGEKLYAEESFTTASEAEEFIKRILKLIM